MKKWNFRSVTQIGSFLQYIMYILHNVVFSVNLKINNNQEPKYILFMYISILMSIIFVMLNHATFPLLFYLFNTYLLYDMAQRNNPPKKILTNIINLNILIIFVLFTCIIINSELNFTQYDQNKKNTLFFTSFIIKAEYEILILFLLFVCRLLDMIIEVIELFLLFFKWFRKKTHSILDPLFEKLTSLITTKRKKKKDYKKRNNNKKFDLLKKIVGSKIFSSIKNEIIVNYHNKIIVLFMLCMYIFMAFLLMFNFDSLFSSYYENKDSIDIAKNEVKTSLIYIFFIFAGILISVYWLKIKWLAKSIFITNYALPLALFMFGSEIIVSSGVFGPQSHVELLSSIFKEAPKITDFIVLYSNFKTSNPDFVYIIQKITAYKDCLVLAALIFLYSMWFLQSEISREHIKIIKTIIIFTFLFNIYIDYLAFNEFYIKDLAGYMDYHFYKNIQSAIFILFLFYLTKFNILIKLIDEEPHIPLRIYFTLVLVLLFQIFIFALFKSPLVSFILFFVLTTLKENIEEDKKTSKLIYLTLISYLIYEIYIYNYLYSASLFKFDIIQNSLYVLLFLLAITLKKQVATFNEFLKTTSRKAIIN